MCAHVSVNHLTLETAPGVSLFDAAETLGVAVPTSCRKQGKCKECVVEVTAGMASLTPRTPAEAHLRGSFRLSCQARVTGDVECHTMRRGRMRVEDGGVNLTSRPGSRHGIAMDLGTTTVVMRLVDLDTGGIIAVSSFENPQRFGGSDVMSRICYDAQHRGLLARTLAGYLSRAIAEFPVDPRTISEMVVAGNSTMRDLFFFRRVDSIGQSPYRSVTELELAEGKRATTALTATGRRSLLPIDPEALVYGAPIISGHVGADAAVCMLAIDLAHEDRLVALMDIGTNTELILGNRRRIVAASCPAGPAFEGGAISCGMPALDGAVEKVAIDDDGAFHLETIGGGAPEGVCGSGLVDLLSELLRTGRMNSMGRFTADETELALTPDLTFRESDINELAQAKAANVAGLQVVARNYGIDFADIDVFYLAGAFGRHMDLESARRIGLIPNLPDSKIVQIGNASIEGATIALLSRARRAELEELVRRVEHCRLETHPDFFDFVVEGCQFKEVAA